MHWSEAFAMDHLACENSGRWLVAACLLVVSYAGVARAGECPPDRAGSYRVVPGDSELRVLVYRGGPLARFGHNHVILATGIEGVVHRGEIADLSCIRLTIPVDGLEVDPPDVRAEEGAAFDSDLSEEDIRKTRANMMGESVLNGAGHPEIRVRSVAMTGSLDSPEARLEIRLRGESREVTVPVTVYESGRRLVMLASLSLRQSTFGIEPFSVLGGGLRVRDELRVRARIVAQPGSEGE